MIIDVEFFAEPFVHIGGSVAILKHQRQQAPLGGMVSRQQRSCLHLPFFMPTIIPPFIVIIPFGHVFLHRSPQQIAILLQTVIAQFQLGGDFLQIHFSLCRGMEGSDNLQRLLDICNLAVFL
ncbi:hypothetical protein D3C71_1509560 [compost metagenome]